VSFLQQLNPRQKEAVLTKSRYVRIIAGAGSGKTRVLTTRIVHLIEDLGVAANSIVAITFTNKAANEMKTRMYKMLGDSAAGVHLSTIHSLCVRILREDCQIMDLPRNFTVLDQDDQKSILKEAYKEIGLDRQKYSFGSMLDYISNNKSAEISVERALILAGEHFGEKEKARVYAFYQNRLHALYALDFDDLLLVTVKMFDMYMDKKQKWQRRFSFIHVDEFQDIDKIQYKLIKQLAGSENEVYVVGDPDQTIYTWRGADVNIIMDFEKEFAPTETIVLAENYRSTPDILNGANSMIKHNKYRVEKDLFTKREPLQKIVHSTFPGEEFEALWVAQKCKELKLSAEPKEHTDYIDMAILYRSNYLSRSIEKGLLDQHIPYVIYGGTRFFDREEVKDMLSYLRMITHGDDLALVRTINKPRRGIGDKTLDTLRLAAKAANRPIYEEMKAERHFTGKMQTTLDKYCLMIEKWRGKTNQMSLIQILDMVADESGLRGVLEEAHEIDRLENIKELINDVETFAQNYPDGKLDEYLQMVSLYGDRNEVLGGDFVQLMTVHAAKGLEFDTVFVVGLSDGVFPNERAMSEGHRGIEEERRLAYVAYTRARNKLYLTDSHGFSMILGKPRTRSRFVDEIDDAHIEHIGVNFEYDKPKEVRLKFSQKVYDTTIPDEMVKKPKIKIKKGDFITHPQYGKGVVIKIGEDGIADIAFDYPHGVKRIMAAHPSLVKEGGVA
jgi:DNA helicase II / ATP-dependent DNA helicase PcrA